MFIYKGRCNWGKITTILVAIGAINWGLVGLGGFFGGNWNVVNLLLGNWMWLENVIYILVGVAGVMSIWHCKCERCSSAMKMHADKMGGQQM